MGLRKSSDGGFFLTRPDKALEEELNRKYIKEGTRWYPKPSGPSLLSLKDKFVGETINIVGKGPSLKRIGLDSFDKGPIVCINESIHALDAIDENLANYGFQFDGSLRETCRPKKAQLILSVGAKGFYPDLEKIIFYPSQFKLGGGLISAIYLLHIGKMMGCSRAKMLCFDACVNKQIGYAYGIVRKYPNLEVKAGERFLKHRRMIESHAKNLGLELIWLCP